MPRYWNNLGVAINVSRLAKAVYVILMNIELYVILYPQECYELEPVT